jgi:murein DD-endopeptidase MepM/ murein hydrolase activator NlpD
LNFPAATIRRTFYLTIAALVMGGLAYNVKQLPSEAATAAASPDVTRVNKTQPIAATTVAEAQIALAPVAEGPELPSRPKITEYTVAEGDTLEAIAARFGVKVDTLVLSNGMESEDDTLSIGQKLIVPAVDALVYKIEEGDNFWTVADQFGTTEEELVKANPDIDPQAIPIGAYVLVPGGDLEHARPLLASRAAGARRTSPAQTHKLATHPVWGEVTDYFGWRTHPVYGTRHFHDGTDFNAGIGTPVAAADSGTVIMAQYYGGYGKTVKIDHGGGVITQYSHLSSYAVDVGQKVEAGQVIAYSGNTGTSTGPHLHFTVIVDGTPVDPLDWLP